MLNLRFCVSYIKICMWYKNNNFYKTYTKNIELNSKVIFLTIFADLDPILLIDFMIFL